MKSNPRNGITSIDHPVIAVRDMEEARQTFMRLGFTVPPRGSHVEWGTGNWCIMFPKDYLELRGIIDTDRPRSGEGENIHLKTASYGSIRGVLRVLGTI